MKADPYLDEGMRGWIEKTARQEHWRISWMEIGDLVQEGYFCYCKVKRAYPQLATVEAPTKEQRKHFQALLTTTFTRHLHTLAAKEKGARLVRIQAPTPNEEVAVWERLVPPQAEAGTLATLLAKAPPEIAQLFKLLTSDGLDLVAYARRKVGRRELRETTNEYYCRLLGLDPAATDIITQAKSYLNMG